MIPVVFRDDASESLRLRVADFGLPSSIEPPQAGQYLLGDADGIALCKIGEKGRVKVDFVNGVAQYRRTKGGGELIAKAVNHTAKPIVWDGTGGLGRDAFVLAVLGLQVSVFEQNPAVACLLADGLARAAESQETAAIVRRITLCFGNAIALMPGLAKHQGRPDVVYLDPMYPERHKSAAVKKEMAYFHDLVGMADDEVALLRVAREVAKKRVVVKRPRLGNFLSHEKPAYQYSGKSTRFDVYLPFQPVNQ
ncbi:class I SAM-dependent methyltransferase [Neisseria wadsworthii]|uniref:Ribosomal RNA small subunit methyltransferase J n=1 Tax=Neisseria wadsworthii 9715 TaxID=1030841 RepID=G4CTM7_9NEIS|nr:class I SAM-dependent methyltransferase [Neisseria wadsworthii]EGZ44132.1 SAM-dependent methyltransferase [Neisseria wadsworthii 9715]QMT36006.1 class I SAM-dependent methyltransferase [Neisseria wadsworthii]